MVAVDFYDGSILYDFHNHQTKICDIDFYRQVPAINDIGEQFWGAARSKSPEEYTLGAPIDARTNVFTMGAIAFGLLGGEMDRSYEKWEAGDRFIRLPCAQSVMSGVSDITVLRNSSRLGMKPARHKSTI